jgi:Ser/Thr protein kinase RdoA (MazF antagonist)
LTEFGPMSADFLNAAALEVVQHYSPLIGPALPKPLGNHGGFSGARLWRIDAPAGPLGLRAWPPAFPPERLRFIHLCMTAARSAGLSFVPQVFAPSGGGLWAEHSGRLWELQEWLPGEANYHRRPSLAKRKSACAALARLHNCWASSGRFESGVCPAVTRRLEAVRQWRELVQSGWRPSEQAVDDSARALAERAWRALANHINLIPGLFRRWRLRIGPLQPCLCDVWHDHLLFDDDYVAGIVDYGAMKIDHPAVDVARLLGSLVEDDAVGWATGLAAYREVRPFTAEEEELARVLDLTGTTVGASVWLRWLFHDGKEFADRAAALRRLEVLVGRMEKWR